jgi:hypothetical protein
MPAAVLNEIEAHGGLWPFVAKVVPGIGEAAWVKRASTSAGLSNSATGAAIVGSDGMHICRFRRKPATYSDLIAATLPI